MLEKHNRNKSSQDWRVPCALIPTHTVPKKRNALGHKHCGAQSPCIPDAPMSARHGQGNYRWLMPSCPQDMDRINDGRMCRLHRQWLSINIAVQPTWQYSACLDRQYRFLVYMQATLLHPVSGAWCAWVSIIPAFTTHIIMQPTMTPILPGTQYLKLVLMAPKGQHPCAGDIFCAAHPLVPVYCPLCALPSAKGLNVGSSG